MRGPSPSPGGRRGVRRVAVAIVLLTLAALVGVSPAAAHSGLTSSSPVPNQVVQGVPQQVRLIFNAPPVTDARTTVAVLSPSGKDLASGGAAVSGMTVAQSLTTSAETGWFTLRFVTVFFDGHLTQGEFRFMVTAADRGSGSTPWLWWALPAVAVLTLGVLTLARRRSATRTSGVSSGPSARRS